MIETPAPTLEVSRFEPEPKPAAKLNVQNDTFTIRQRQGEIGVLLAFGLFALAYIVGTLFFKFPNLLLVLAILGVVFAVVFWIGTGNSIVVSGCNGKATVSFRQTIAFIPVRWKSLELSSSDLLIQRTKGITPEEMNRGLWIVILLTPVCLMGLLFWIIILSGRERAKNTYWIELEIKSPRLRKPLLLHRKLIPEYRGGPIPEDAANMVTQIQRITGVSVSSHHRKSAYYPTRAY